MVIDNIKNELKRSLYIKNKMKYKGELNREIFDLDEIFVENSLVIKEFVKVCSNEDVISLSYDDMDRELLDISVKLMRALVENDRKCIKFKGEFMVDGNMEKIVRVLNMVNFYDIKVLEEYLVNFFVEKLRDCNNEQELRDLFNGG
jgi:hypothetical protein